MVGMRKPRTPINRHSLRGEKSVFSPAVNLEGVYTPEGEFIRVYHEDIFADEKCEFYRGSYVERQLVVSQRLIADLKQTSEIYGFYRNREYIIERESLLKYLDENHFKQYMGPEDNPAVIESTRKAKPKVEDREIVRRKEPTPEVAYHDLKHDFLPELWAPDRVAEYIFERSPDAGYEKNTIHRQIERYTKQGYVRGYRIKGLWRYSREDWLASLRAMASVDLKKPQFGRQMRSLYTILGPFIASVIKAEGIDEQAWRDFFEFTKWKYVLRKSKDEGIGNVDAKSAKEEAEERYGLNPLYYIDKAPTDEKVRELLEQIQNEMYSRV